MTIQKRIMLWWLLIFAISALYTVYSVAGAQGRTCDGRTERFNLAVRVADNRPTEVRLGPDRMDDLYVCPGDTVAWILQGRGFTIEFADDSPFDFDQRRADANAGRVSAVVREDAFGPYKYSIHLDGGDSLDPRIIVQK